MSHDGHNEAMMGRGPAPGADRTSPARGALPLLAAVVVALIARLWGDDGGLGAEPASTSLSVLVEPGETAPGGRLEARVVKLRREVHLRRRIELEPQGAVGRGQAAAAPDAGDRLPRRAGRHRSPRRRRSARDAQPGSWRVVIDRRVPGVGTCVASSR